MFPVFNGTGANVVSLVAMARRRRSSAPEGAHINVDEFRKLLGQAIDVPPWPGKLTVEPSTARWGTATSTTVAKVVSLTESTELGTVHRRGVREADWAHGRGLLVHVDGARFANAAASLGVSLGDLAGDSDIDMLSFGATKNGALGAEAVVVLKPGLADVLPFLRKQSMQLASKMRFVSAQLVALLEGDLWLRNATHANAMAARLAAALDGVDGVRISHPVQVNAVFAVLAREHIEALQSRHTFYVWDENADQVRWMTLRATSTRAADGATVTA
jgi:threonine aldolase